MSESESPYKVQGSRVYGKGKSFNCINIVNAQDLAGLLNEYETYKTLNTNIQQQYDSITKQLIQIKLSIGTLNEEIHTLEEQIQCLSK
jgi:phage shock protein A